MRIQMFQVAAAVNLKRLGTALASIFFVPVRLSPLDPFPKS
jgi:hypothetical protein